MGKHFHFVANLSFENVFIQILLMSLLISSLHEVHYHSNQFHHRFLNGLHIFNTVDLLGCLNAWWNKNYKLSYIQATKHSVISHQQQHRRMVYGVTKSFLFRLSLSFSLFSFTHYMQCILIKFQSSNADEYAIRMTFIDNNFC